MVTSTVILSLLTTVIGYGFPYGNGFEPGTIHVGLPASAIPNIIGPATRLALARVAAKASRRLGSAQLTACSLS